jgi:hypothetical protein
MGDDACKSCGYVKHAPSCPTVAPRVRKVTLYVEKDGEFANDNTDGWQHVSPVLSYPTLTGSALDEPKPCACKSILCNECSGRPSLDGKPPAFDRSPPVALSCCDAPSFADWLPGGPAEDAKKLIDDVHEKARRMYGITE